RDARHPRVLSCLPGRLLRVEHRSAVPDADRDRGHRLPVDSHVVSPRQKDLEMIPFLQRLRQTKLRKIMLLPRLLAGIPLVAFSAMHFMNPEHFRNILTAAGVPMVELNVWAASSSEMLGGLLLLTGFFARVGAILGIGTMAPAILATIRLAGLSSAPKV